MIFIENLAKKLIESYSEELSKIAVVLPSRRACLYLQKSIAKAVQKTILLPQIISIEEYIFEQSGLKKIDETALLTLLYSVYKEYTNDAAYPLEEFLTTGKTMLLDFNDVDDYLLNPEEVFTYLLRIREIENWFPGEAKSPLQSKYMKFYNLLNPIYSRFYEKCLEINSGYQGLASRILSQKEDVGYSKVIFASLNAITPSLEAHINKLIERGKADLLWDVDEWYFNNRLNEAGHFLRLNKKSWEKSFLSVEKSFSESSKNIDIVGAPLGFSQVQTAIELLNTKYIDDFSETVLVLADESLLMPLLSCLPASFEKKINISGGYPLKNSFVGQLLNAILNLEASVIDENESPIYKYDFLLPLISNPLIKLLVPAEKTIDFNEVLNSISQGYIRFFKWDNEGEDREDSALLRSLDEILPNLISPCNSWVQNIDNIVLILSEIFEKTPDEEVEHEAAWLVLSMLKSLKNTLVMYSEGCNITTLSVIFFIKRQLQISKIPLKGEPFVGLQILGMLETRALDFKNVIILGANEGHLPASGLGDSFLPNDVRSELNLPCQYERDAVYAYHFWRLLQRASEIMLIYNTEPDPLFGKEPSRFLAQIEHELAEEFCNIKVSKKVLSVDYCNSKVSFKDLFKPKIEYGLKRIAEKGLSFSAIANFIACPLRFLFANIFKISEWENNAGNMPANLMGSVFHKTMQDMFQSLLHKKIIKKDIDKLLCSYREVLDNAFVEKGIKHTNSGYNFLVKEVLCDSFESFLNGAYKCLNDDCYLQDVERKLEAKVCINNNIYVNLVGIADRIEIINGIPFIFDFKTTYKVQSLSFNSKDDANFIDDKSSHNQYLLQLLFYIWLYSKNEKVNKIGGGIYYVLNKNNFKQHFVFRDKDIFCSDENTLSLIDMFFTSIIESIFSPTQDFKETPSGNVCKYCPYNEILCFANVYEESEE